MHFWARVAVGICGSLIGSLAWAQTARPTTVGLLPGVVEIRNVQYAAGTSPDLAQPAAGGGELAVTIKGRTFTKPGVTFTNLLTDERGALRGISLLLDSPFEFDAGLDTKLRIPNGQSSFVAPNKLAFNGKGSLVLPFRSANGDPITCEVGALEAGVSPGGGELQLKEIRLNSAALSEGLVLPGLQVKTETANFRLVWTTSAEPTWKLTFPASTLGVGIPNLPTEPAYPLRARAADLAIDQDGDVSCREAEVEAGVGFALPELAGFDLTIKGGRLSVNESLPTFSALKFDIRLPPGITSGVNDVRAILEGVDVDLRQGFFLDLTRAYDLKLQGLRLTGNRLVIDFSDARSATGAPTEVAALPWKGIWVPTGKVTVPIPEVPAVDFRDFRIETGGLSGNVQLAWPGLKLQGFTMGAATGGLEVLRNQLKRGEVQGGITLTNLGTLRSRIHFDLSGKYAASIDASELKFPDLGLSLKGVRGRFDGPNIALSGELGFDAAFVAQQASLGMPAELGQIRFGLSDLRIDATGKIRLPSEGWISLPDPLEIDFKLFLVEVRRVGFTSDGVGISSVTFTGGARLPGPIEGLPLKGELDFEGFSVGKSGNGPKFALGGLGLEAEIPSVGTISGSLYRKNIPTFGDTLYGDAELKLDCLGDVAGGIGLEFLLAPDKQAWFIGGSVETPAILVQIPASPPVPIFTIKGFSGGFGMNVLPKAAGVGRITEPDRELVYGRGAVLFQAGLLLADPVAAAPGRVWWADSALTVTLNPVIVDLTARMAFLDPEGARYLDIDDWESLDRIARVYMTFDSRGPSFMIGGDAELFFPTRSASLLDASGEALLKVSPTEKFIRIGWRDAGQRPLNIHFARMAEEVASIDAKMGMEITFTPISGGLRTSGQMYLEADASLKLPGAEFAASLDGYLALIDIGGREFSARGNVTIEGMADFGFFTARGYAGLDAQFNTPSYRKQLRLRGTLRGKAGPFEASVPVVLTMPVKQ